MTKSRMERDAILVSLRAGTQTGMAWLARPKKCQEPEEPGWQDLRPRCYKKTRNERNRHLFSALDWGAPALC